MEEQFLSKENSSQAMIQRDFEFAVNQQFKHGETIFRISQYSASECVLQNSMTLESKFIETSKLHELYLSKAITPYNETNLPVKVDKLAESAPTIPAHLINLSPAVLKHGQTVIKYVNALRELGYTSLYPTPLLELEFKRLKETFLSTGVADTLNDLSLSTVYSWSIRIDRAGGDWRAAFPMYAKRGGTGGVRISSEALTILNEIWTSIKKDKNKRIRFSDIHSELHHRLRIQIGDSQAFAILPSRSTIERLTKKEFGAYIICVRNYGKKEADKRYRSWYPRERATAPLQVIEFDDKDTRVFLIDERSGLPYGRAFVTAGVDQYSTVPLGLSIGDSARSTLSALDAFRKCILPKSTESEFSLLDDPPEFFGQGDNALFDNALPNHSKALERVVHESSSSMCSWSKPYTPTEKSTVEDFFGRMASDFLAELPGFGGPKKFKDMLSNGLSSATMRLEDFAQKLNKWTYDVYCNTPRATGFTPRQLWHEAMRNCIQRLPANLDLFDAIFALERSVELRPNGIQFTGLSYQNSELITLRRQIGDNAKIIFRYHPNDLTRVFVLDPYQKHFFVVPSTSLEYTNSLTLAQHKWIRKLARARKITNPSIPQLLNAREELRKLTEQLRFSKKRIERKRAQAIGTLEKVQSIDLYDELPDEAITELEYQLDQISEIELPPQDESDWELPESF